MTKLQHDRNTTQKGDPPLISQLQVNFFTIREISCFVLTLCCHFVISQLRTAGKTLVFVHKDNSCLLKHHIKSIKSNNIVLEANVNKQCVLEMPLLKCYQFFCNKNRICVTCLLDFPQGWGFLAQDFCPGAMVLQLFAWGWGFCPFNKIVRGSTLGGGGGGG